jgi:predicted alpha/beta superfamily hydrolase
MPRSLPIRALAFAALPVAALAAPAIGAGAGEPIVIGESHTIDSRRLGEERTVLVSVPAGYERSSAHYPVLYVLDGESQFHHTTGTVAFLSRAGHIPPLLVVGVVNTDRTRDLTPPWTTATPPANWTRAAELGGGADAFRAFLAEELLPWVEGRYRTAPMRILAGYSFGGLFTMEALLAQPDLFQGWLAISPTLSWNHDTIERRLRELLRRPDLAGHLVVTFGREDDAMEEQFFALEETLRHLAPPTLKWHAELLPWDTHATMPGPSVDLGLRRIFAKWPLPGFAAEEGLAGLDEHFARLSLEYGYRRVASEAQVNLFGYRLLAAGDVDSSIATFEENVRRFPESANVYDSLADALEAAGRLAEAEDLVREAVRRARASEDTLLPQFEAHLAALRTRRATS